MKIPTITERMIFIGLIIALSILSFISIQSCNHNKENAIIANLKLNKDSATFTEKLDKLGNAYIQQEQTIATQEEAIKAGLISQEELKAKNIKDVNSIVRLTQKINILNDSILKYKNDSNNIITVIDTTTHDTTNYLKLPNSVSSVDKWLSFHGSILKEGFRIDSLQLINDQTIIIGNSKKWFLGKNIPVVDVQNSNPYFKVNKMSNVVIEYKTPWYQKNVTWFIVGAVATYFIVK